MAKIGVDPDCVELARKFLVDEQTRVPISDEAAARNLTSLSEHIQQAVEDWFEAQNWEPHLDDEFEPCTFAAHRAGCICRMSSVNTATIDPPEPVIDRDCPLHGRDRDPDDARQQRIDDMAAEPAVEPAEPILCGGMCKFWSEMIAKAEGGGGVQALCLSPKSPHFSKYTFGHQGCEFGEIGTPIDDPSQPPSPRDLTSLARKHRP